MNGSISRYLTALLIVWAGLMFFVLHSLGEPAQPVPSPVVRRPQPQPPKAAEVAQPVIVKEEPPAPLAVSEDELDGYQPCPGGKSLGQMNFKSLEGHYDGQGRFVLKIPYQGTVGQYQVLEDLSLPRPVTAVDFQGQISASVIKFQAPLEQGPVGAVIIGDHKRFHRISFNYQSHSSPVAVEKQIVCQPETSTGGEIAIRLTFSPRTLPTP
ncbi:MAG: hypothetical protein LBT47_03705 [Deltaproteobacteria bacterium]|jgi:hypothetical protein|nr:hypothetical protein [Deltaproteobacteria bacterium]